MKAYVKLIVEMLDEYTDRQARIDYLSNEIKAYRKVLETLDALESSDANDEIISKVKEEIMKDEAFIAIYTDECNEIADKVENTYDCEVSYSQIWRDDFQNIEGTMRYNVSSDLNAGYSIEKIKDELSEIEEYVHTMENRYRELKSNPNGNAVFFAELVNKGACGLN